MAGSGVPLTRYVGICYRLNPKNPNRDDGAEYGQAGYRPARHVNRAIRFRPVDHPIVPVGHESLLEIASGG